MHPINKVSFGVHGVLARFHNGTSVVNGYVTKQLGTTRYQVTDGTNSKTCTLAQTNAQISAIGTAPYCTMHVSAPASSGTGATFTPTYGAESALIVSAGSGWTTADAIVATGGLRPTGSLTVATPVANNTITLNGTVITFVASGATGSQVNIGGTPTLTATNLYTFLTGSADAQVVKCNFVQTGAVITLISKTVGTTDNSFTLASNSANVTVSGATLTGGVASPAGTPPTLAATATAGAVTGVTVSVAGSYTTFPTNPVTGYFNGNGHAPVQLTMRYKIVSIAASGGSGYTVGQTLIFNGLVSTSVPTAHVNSTGAATAVVVDGAGTGITTAPTSIGVAGTLEHVKALYESVLLTVEGHRYVWHLATSLNGSAFVYKYS